MVTPCPARAASYRASPISRKNWAREGIAGGLLRGRRGAMGWRWVEQGQSTRVLQSVAAPGARRDRPRKKRLN